MSHTTIICIDKESREWEILVDRHTKRYHPKVSVYIERDGKLVRILGALRSVILDVDTNQYHVRCLFSKPYKGRICMTFWTGVFK